MYNPIVIVFVCSFRSRIQTQYHSHLFKHFHTHFKYVDYLLYHANVIIMLHTFKFCVIYQVFSPICITNCVLNWFVKSAFYLSRMYCISRISLEQSHFSKIDRATYLPAPPQYSNRRMFLVSRPLKYDECCTWLGN